MSRAIRSRLDRLAHRLGPRETLTKAEVYELATLETERASVPPFELMDHAQLEEWARTWGCGPKGARLDELRQRARTPEERREDEEQTARIAAMSMAELDNWLIAHMREGLVDLEGEELAKAEAVISANVAYFARSRTP